MKFLGLVLFAVLLVQGQAQLQCYQCNDCAKVTSQTASACSVTTTASPATVSTASSSSSASSSSVTTPSSSSSSVATPTSSSSSVTTPTSSSSSVTTPTPSSSSVTTPSTSSSSVTTESSSSSSVTTPASSSTSEGPGGRFRRAARADGDWSCFVEQVKDEKNATVFNRGCTQNKDYCKNPIAGNKCDLCTKDKCNSSAALKLSLITLLSALIMIFSVFK